MACALPTIHQPCSKMIPAMTAKPSGTTGRRRRNKSDANQSTSATPSSPLGFAVIAGIILLQGWWMVGNAHTIYDSTYGLFVPVRAIFLSGAGSADYALSLAWMLRATALLALVCFVAELSQRQAWLLRLWSAIALAGGSIALLGLIQK